MASNMEADGSLRKRALPPRVANEKDMNGSGNVNGSKRRRRPTAETKHRSSISRPPPPVPDIENGLPSAAMGSRENLVQDDRKPGRRTRRKKITRGLTDGDREDSLSRLSHADSQEDLDGTRDIPTKRRARRSIAKHDGGAVSGVDDDGRGVPTHPWGRPPVPGKSKKRRKIKRAHSDDDDYLSGGEVNALDLIIAAEDIVTDDRPTRDDQQHQPPHTVVLPSHPGNKLFTERKTCFKSEDKRRIAKQRERAQSSEQLQTEALTTTTQVTLSTHHASLAFSLFCHGLLAGFALWHCVTVAMLHNPVPSSSLTGTMQFLEHYNRLAQPTMALYYFLLAICTVSAFDRFDVGQPDKHFFHGLMTCQSGAMSILIYLATFIVNVSVSAIDDRLGLFLSSTPPYCGEECPETEPWWLSAEADRLLKVWKVINIIRAVGSCIGWVIIALTPTTDYTSDHLHDAEEPLWNEDQETSLNNYQSAP